MTKFYRIILSTLFVCTLALSAHAGDLDAFTSQNGTLKIAGGTAHIPVMKEAAKLIMQANPNIRITIAGGGSGVGIKQVGEGLIDIGNAGRKATEKEVATYGLVMYKWAVDGVGVVVNPKNPVTKLTTAPACRTSSQAKSATGKSWAEQIAPSTCTTVTQPAVPALFFGKRGC